MKNYRVLQQKYLVNTYPDRAVCLVNGQGVYLWSEKGERYLDLMTNYGVNIFGYGHPAILRALNAQLGKLTTLHGSFNNDMRAEAARALVSRCGGGLTKVYLSNSGAEAVEAALKFAVLATGKKKFVSCRGGYHGKTLGALSANSEEKYTRPFEPLLWDFHIVDFNDSVQLEAALDRETAAFLVEPIQGESGIIRPDNGYLNKARELCTEKQVLMILDEIQTGAGRTGRFLASEREVDSYDILCLGKGLAGGIPVGATLVSEQVASTVPRSIHTSTFGGNPLAAAGIAAVTDLLDETMLTRIRDTGRYFLEGLQGISSDLIADVRGEGLMLGVDVGQNRNAVLQSLQKHKILAIPAGDSIVRFLPPYILEKDHVDQAVDIVSLIVREM